MLPLILIVIYSTTAFGGTLCPPREDIYPCNCINVPINKKLMHTIVNCHHLPHSGVLSSIMRSLKPVQIDQFHIYNSFWDAHKDGLTETKAVLPTDWLTLLRIKEMEIYDSALSSCFACQSKLTCKNTVTNSWNQIKEIDSKQFGFLKGLKSLILASNDIVELKEVAWKNVPSSITLVDLTDNPIHCDCNIRWINGTFVVHVAILGTCSSPEDYEDSAYEKHLVC
ncbi:Slit protein like [Argiope bruennichi]|uniref:Slit protein like n=1 Tax=Argiope bruennichi TaxID=94029 RepID=A0A8T0EXF6_ARGBR|nr:Slit protein like [Argiope bruennichi]